MLQHNYTYNHLLLIFQTTLRAFLRDFQFQILEKYLYISGGLIGLLAIQEFLLYDHNFLLNRNFRNCIHQLRGTWHAYCYITFFFYATCSFKNKLILLQALIKRAKCTEGFARKKETRVAEHFGFFQRSTSGSSISANNEAT